MTQIKSIKASQLRSFCEQAKFTFKTTKDLTDFKGLIGQNRAIEALSFGLEIERPGYNMYLMGSKGLGKHTLLKIFLDKTSSSKSSTDDWCYVFNFEETQNPCAIRLSAGQARQFRAQMQHIVSEFKSQLARFFSTKNKNDFDEIKDSLSISIRLLTEKYRENEKIFHYLMNVEVNLVKSLGEFLHSDRVDSSYADFIEFMALHRYEMNIIVDNTSVNKAPVIINDDPSIENLFGKVEYLSHMGSFVSDYRYIKCGALHQANGGYLIVDADKLLSLPKSWQALKNALMNNKIKIPSNTFMSNGVYPISLYAEEIPLNVKVILVGSRENYNKLIENDEEYTELFKVEVDFSDSLNCTKDSLNDYAQVLATLIRKNNLSDFDLGAIEAVIEYSMRQVEDTALLSIHMHSMQDLLIEANFWANKKRKDNTVVVQRIDVQNAVNKEIFRVDRSRKNIYDEINKGTLRIDVCGEKVAVVNGLFIIESGRFEFSQPARITATVRIGDGDFLDIEREVDLGGSLHSKGVFILSSYLGSHYATTKPLSIKASLVFEQSYGSVDGDSATVGELCALLSAISGLAVKQSLAITGSADQHGNVQAIGGINEKIEGFFDICKLQELNGEQGVIIPESNIPHLILRKDVVDAIEKNQFYIYPVNTVDEAISILTGLPAGERNKKMEFPENSVNYKVEKRLLEFAELKNAEHN